MFYDEEVIWWTRTERTERRSREIRIRRSLMSRGKDKGEGVNER